MAHLDLLVGRDEWPAVNAAGRPFVIHKVAATLDGRTAAADGSSRWITGPESRSEVHRLRAACQATLVGSGTVVADDPHLAVRGEGAPAPADQPLRVVVDSAARTPAGARVLDDAAPTLIAVAAGAETGHLDGRATVVPLPRADRGLDLQALLAALHERGVHAAFLEGGPTLAGSLHAAGLVDRVIQYVAPALLGAGSPALGDCGVTSMDGIVRLDLVDVARVGTDVRLVARPQR